MPKIIGKLQTTSLVVSDRQFSPNSEDKKLVLTTEGIHQANPRNYTFQIPRLGTTYATGPGSDAEVVSYDDVGKELYKLRTELSTATQDLGDQLEGINATELNLKERMESLESEYEAITGFGLWMQDRERLTHLEHDSVLMKHKLENNRMRNDERLYAIEQWFRLLISEEVYEPWHLYHDVTVKRADFYNYPRGTDVSAFDPGVSGDNAINHDKPLNYYEGMANGALQPDVRWKLPWPVGASASGLTVQDPTAEGKMGFSIALVLKPHVMDPASIGVVALPRVEIEVEVEGQKFENVTFVDLNGTGWTSSIMVESTEDAQALNVGDELYFENNMDVSYVVSSVSGQYVNFTEQVQSTLDLFSGAYTFRKATVSSLVDVTPDSHDQNMKLFYDSYVLYLGDDTRDLGLYTLRTMVPMKTDSLSVHGTKIKNVYLRPGVDEATSQGVPFDLVQLSYTQQGISKETFDAKILTRRSFELVDSSMDLDKHGIYDNAFVVSETGVTDVRCRILGVGAGANIIITVTHDFDLSKVSVGSTVAFSCRSDILERFFFDVL